MTYNRITWVPDVLRAAKLNVIVEPDFATTGHTAKEGWPTFDPQYLFWHHDASPVGPSPGVLDWLKSPARPAQLWVCDGSPESHNGEPAHLPGTWHCVTSGVAWHAGLGGPFGSMPKDQANPYSIGVETDHTTGEQWSAQRPVLDSLRIGSAAILKHLAFPADRMLFHKTWAPGRKVDIDGLDLATERSILTTLMKTVPKPVPTPPLPTKEDEDMEHIVFGTNSHYLLSGGKAILLDQTGVSPAQLVANGKPPIKLDNKDLPAFTAAFVTA